MPFEKGNQINKGRIPWNKGRFWSQEIKDKISKAAKENSARYWKGKKFSQKHCINISKAKRQQPRMIKTKDSHGYFRLYCPKHPYCDIKKSVFEHRLVMEKHLGRYLKPTEIVHHIDSIPTNNHIENLILFANEKAHKKFHHQYTSSYKK